MWNMFNVNTKVTVCEICSKLTIKTPELHQWRHSDDFIVNYEHISHLFLPLLLSSSTFVYIFVDFEHVFICWNGLCVNWQEKCLQGFERTHLKQQILSWLIIFGRIIHHTLTTTWFCVSMRLFIIIHNTLLVFDRN